MSEKHYRIVWQDELVYNNPPIPYIFWDESAVKKFLHQRGFDLHKTICKVLDFRGWCWVQRK